MTILQKIKETRLLLRRLYYVNVRKDEFMRQIYKWKDDNGDKTLRLDYPLNEHSIVVDAGGYLGDFAADICCKYNPYIYIFEPVKCFYEKTKARFANNSKVKVFHAGLSDQSIKTSISVNSTSSSIYTPGSGDIENIEMISIAEFIKEYELSEINLMKINIEGGEYPLLNSLIDNDQLNIVQYYQIQFHDFIPDAVEKRNEIRGELEKNYNLLWDYPFVWESWAKK